MAALRFFFYLLMKPAALGMAFLGIAGILSPYISPETWWIPAFSGLFMPIIIIGNIFLLLFWSIHKKWWVIFPILTILGNYNYYNSIFQWPWKKKPNNDKISALTVGSYNVEGFYWIAKNEVQKPIIKLIEKYHIDIFCIQEHCEESNIDSTTLKKRIGLPFRETFFNRHTSWTNFGISIYSRYPILQSGKIDFQSQQNCSMWADILVGKDTIRVINNHLQTTNVSFNKAKYKEYRSVKNWSGQARTLVHILEQLKNNFKIRARQAQLIRQIIDTTRYPIIVCGDFNDTPLSYAFNHIVQSDLQDGFTDCGKGYGHSFKGIKGLLRIDFIAYSEQLKGIEYFSPHLPWSDHNPVIMRIGY